MKITTAPDGRVTYSFRQSWIGTALTCLERARREAFEDLTSSDTDATIIGMAGHTAIEHALTHLRDIGDRVSAAFLTDLALDAYHELAASPDVRWIQGDYADGVAYLKMMMPAWHREVFPQITDQVLLEQHFDVPFYETDDYDVRLTGTIDCLDLGTQTIWDWKHTGREMKQWEKQRYSVQATVYAHAAAQVGILTYPVSFNFTNARKFKTEERCDVIRTQRTGHHALFLAAQLDDLIALHRAGLKSWPRVDQHSLCSEKWCPAFATCKGAFLTDEEFRWSPNR